MGVEAHDLSASSARAPCWEQREELQQLLGGAEARECNRGCVWPSAGPRLAPHRLPPEHMSKENHPS